MMEPAASDAGDSALLKDLADLLDERDEREEEGGGNKEVSALRGVVPPELLGGLMLEALNGFLFLLNEDGIVDFVSDATQEFIGKVMVTS